VLLNACKIEKKKKDVLLLRWLHWLMLSKSAKISNASFLMERNPYFTHEHLTNVAHVQIKGQLDRNIRAQIGHGIKIKYSQKRRKSSLSEKARVQYIRELGYNFRRCMLKNRIRFQRAL